MFFFIESFPKSTKTIFIPFPPTLGHVFHIDMDKIISNSYFKKYIISLLATTIEKQAFRININTF